MSNVKPHPFGIHIKRAGLSDCCFFFYSSVVSGLLKEGRNEWDTTDYYRRLSLEPFLVTHRCQSTTSISNIDNEPITFMFPYEETLKNLQMITLKMLQAVICGSTLRDELLLIKFRFLLTLSRCPVAFHSLLWDQLLSSWQGLIYFSGMSICWRGSNLWQSLEIWRA